jgi:DNA (cytosine-5)-methyltransferase 1
MIRIADLFSGIGGIRLAFEKSAEDVGVDVEFVFASEIDRYACKTYEMNFGEQPHGDIKDIDAADVPDHDIFLAGFPCQPFSLAGVSKKRSLGEKTGFDEKKSGNLFFEIVRILKEKKPEAFLLENVKGLLSHNRGNDIKLIIHTLEEELGYVTKIRIIDGALLVPQHRERVYIVGFRSLQGFEFPVIEDRHPCLKNILEKSVAGKYTIGPGTWETLIRHRKNHADKGNGFGYSIADPDGISRTLSHRYHKDGAEILIDQPDRERPRKLTPRECARLMGFPDEFIIPVSDTRAYMQFGNSVVVPVLRAIAGQMLSTFKEQEKDGVSGRENS